jgi:hypothetical protein
MAANDAANPTVIATCRRTVELSRRREQVSAERESVPASSSVEDRPDSAGRLQRCVRRRREVCTRTPTECPDRHEPRQACAPTGVAPMGIHSVLLAPIGIRPPAPDLGVYARYRGPGVRRLHGPPRPSTSMGRSRVLLAPTGMGLEVLARKGIDPDQHPPRQPQAPGRKAADADAPPNGLRQPPLLTKWLTSGKRLTRCQRAKSPRFSGRLNAVLGGGGWHRLTGCHKHVDAPSFMSLAEDRACDAIAKCGCRKKTEEHGEKSIEKEI